MLLTFNGNNRISTPGYQYDAAGNLLMDNLNCYTYDAENRLSSVAPETFPGSDVCGATTMSYLYAPDGRRVAKMQNGSVLKANYYDAAGHMIAETDGSGALQRAEIFAGGRHLATWAGNATYFNHADWLGTERARTNSAGTLCETITSLPFGDGEVTSGNCTSATPNFFTGLERDAESGLDHTLNRQYPSNIGRWLTSDDFHTSKVADPQSWNEYAYAENNPTTLTDPTGEKASVSVGDCNTDDKGNKTCNATVTATIAIYSVNGTNDDEMKQAQAALTSQFDQAGTGSFTMDGTTYNVKTDVTVNVADSEKAGVDSGAQNVIGIDSSGKTQNSYIDPNSSRSYDTGVLDFHNLTTGVARHEFTHLLGLDDNHGPVLSNSNHAVVDPNMKMTPADFRWAFGPELTAGKKSFTVGQREGTNFWGNARGNRKWWEGPLSRH